MIYLFKGADDYLKKKELEKLIDENVDKDFEVFDLEETFGDNVTYDRVINGASIVPVGTKKRVFLIRFAHKIPKEDQKIIAENLSKINNEGVLIFHTPAPEVKDGKISPSSEVIPDLEKAIKKLKNGKILDFSLITKKKDIAAKVYPFVTNLFKEEGKKITPGAVALLVERVGTDSILLNTEIQKVICYGLNETTITEEIIKKVTSATAEEKIFDFLDQVVGKQGVKAFSNIQSLFSEGKDPMAVAIKTITLLRSQVTLIWQGLILIKINPRGLEQIINSNFVTNSVKKEDIDEKYHKYFTGNSLLSKASWQQSKILKISKKSTVMGLAKWIFYLEEADEAVKSGVEAPIDIIKMLTYKMVRL